MEQTTLAKVMQRLQQQTTQTHSWNDIKKQESVITSRDSINILELDHAQL